MQLSTQVKKELKYLNSLSDEHIDYSDIPEIDFTQLGEPVIGKFYRPIKKQISIRLDMDVLDWLKSKSSKYQSLINKICRLYYLKHKKA